MPDVPWDGRVTDIDGRSAEAEVCDPKLDEPGLDASSGRLGTVAIDNVRARARWAALNAVQYKLRSTAQLKEN